MKVFNNKIKLNNGQKYQIIYKTFNLTKTYQEWNKLFKINNKIENNNQ